jgi:hypothetical protein
LTARNPFLPQIFPRNSQSYVVVLNCAVANENGVTKRALSDKMRFVFTRGEVDRAVILRCHFAIDRHGKGNGDEWSLALHQNQNVKRSTSNTEPSTV